MRVVAVALAGLLGAAGPVLAQTAVPPDRATLDRVNLRTEWTAAVPLSGPADAVSLVQVADNNQVFVQTRHGLLVAFDATTGAVQWRLQYDAREAPELPVAWTDRHVFAVNVITLFAIQRYTGQIDLRYNLPLTPTAAPAADGDTFYVVMNGQRLASYDLPAAVRMPDRVRVTDPRAGAAAMRPRNPADVVAARNPPPERNSQVIAQEERFDEKRVTLGADAGAGVGSLQRTPSLATAASMLPPYRAFDDRGHYLYRTESLSLAGSLRQPYTMKSPTGQIQRTPSVVVLPPSVAAVYEKMTYLPTGPSPKLNWVYGSTVRMTHPPLLTRQRLWSATESDRLLAVLREDRHAQVDARIPAPAAAPAAQAEDVGYFPLADGNLLAVDLTGGSGRSLSTVWRANVGGLMNQRPLVTADSVFQAGEFAGVARLDRASGELFWRTESTADQLLAVNKDRAYVRDRRGRVVVYDLHRTEVGTNRAVALGAIDLAAFPVGVTNDQTDRLFLAGANGLLVCLRDSSAAYTAPYRVAPPLRKSVLAPSATKPGESALPADAPPAAPEKKDPQKKH
jgi:outer membrane protein assembly factor BamB